MQIGKYCVTLLIALCMTAGSASAVNWVSAPLACLPDRAVIWNNGAEAELCHCPPQSMCPQQSATVTPANVNFNVSLDVKTNPHGNSAATNHMVTVNFTLSGTDVANYYNSAGTFNFVNYPSLSFTSPGIAKGNSPYAPFDPTQIFVMQDHTSYGCPGGVDAGGAWGAIPDYLTPLTRQYLVDTGVPYNASANDPSIDNLCSRENGVFSYGVTVTVSDTLASQITQATQLPPTLVSNCCPQTSFTCPQSQGVQVGQANSASCQETVNLSRLGCLLEGTPVLTASGKNKKVEDIALGDRLKGEHGEVTVIAINKFTQSADEMYSFNGGTAFITSEHPILTTRGWKSINPQFTSVKSGIGPIGKLSAGDEIITRTGTLKITSIEKHAIHAPAIAYNLSVKGGDGFIANDVVVKGFSQVEIHY